VENQWADVLVDAHFLIIRRSAYGHNTVHDYGFWLSRTNILEEPTALKVPLKYQELPTEQHSMTCTYLLL